jgi:hypothetical protein
MRLDPAVQQLIWLNLAGVPARLVHHPRCRARKRHATRTWEPAAAWQTRSRGRTARRSLQPRRRRRRGESEHCLRCCTREAVLLRPLRTGGSTWVPQWCETDTSSKNSFPPATSCSRMIPRPAA